MSVGGNCWCSTVSLFHLEPPKVRLLAPDDSRSFPNTADAIGSPPTCLLNPGGPKASQFAIRTGTAWGPGQTSEQKHALPPGTVLGALDLDGVLVFRSIRSIEDVLGLPPRVARAAGPLVRSATEVLHGSMVSCL